MLSDFMCKRDIHEAVGSYFEWLVLFISFLFLLKGIYGILLKNRNNFIVMNSEIEKSRLNSQSQAAHSSLTQPAMQLHSVLYLQYQLHFMF